MAIMGHHEIAVEKPKLIIVIDVWVGVVHCAIR
jgi:hypothetical protein